MPDNNERPAKPERLTKPAPQKNTDKPKAARPETEKSIDRASSKEKRPEKPKAIAGEVKPGNLNARVSANRKPYKKPIKNNLVFTVFAFVFILIILYGFNYLANHSNKRRNKATKDEIEQLMDYDMDADYPKTPRDAVKLYCRYMKQIYTMSPSEDELKAMNSKMFMMYSSELKMYNSEAGTLDKLKTSLEKMEKEGYKFKSYLLPEASQVVYYEREGKEMASMEVEMSVQMSGSSIGKYYEQFVLIKEDGKWRILAFGSSKM